jgi:methyl-accepting chemotaxis protein
MSFSLRNLTIAGIVSLVLFNAATIALISRTKSVSLAASQNVETHFDRLKDQVIPLGTLIKSVQLDVIQVQQFFSDVSATRGQDGLDDGFAKAAEYADRFKADVAAARAVAEKLGRTDMRDELDGAVTAFAEFYRIGHRMAETYVAGGPAAGNKMMPDFDERTDAMNRSMEALLTTRDGIIEETTSRIAEEVDAVKDTISGTAMITSTAAAIATLGLVLAAFAFVRFVVRPIGALTTVMDELTSGKRGVVVPHIDMRTEIGRMARATDVFRVAIEDREALQSERAREEERARDENRRQRLVLADNFAATVASVVETVGQVAETISASAHRVDGIAQATAGSAGAAATAVATASSNVATVAAATDELSGAIDEVGRRMHQAGTVSATAAAQAEKTNAIVKDLSDSTQRIGEIVDLINAIASQTNLLALNATIEAARAGEAGRGFAVVAQEVKNLAGQTAKATEEIARQIATVQSVTGDAVAAIRDITATVDEISAISRSIIVAVDEQTSATREIARSIDDAAAGAAAVGTNIRAVDQSTRETSDAAGSMVAASDELSAVSRRLRSEVEGFVARIRA